MELIQWIVIFIAALAVLIKAADYFTDTAEKVGLHFKIPPFIIGVTIVALGTSLPELATSITSVFTGNSEIVIGNVVGSNVANILLVLGVAAIIGKHLTVTKEIINIDLPILLGSAILIYITTADGKFNYIDGTICILTLVTYVLYNIKSHRPLAEKQKREISKLKKEEKKKKDHLQIKYPLILIASGIVIAIASSYTIDAVTKISTILNIGKEIIAVSVVAIGTSLPELAVTIVAAKKGKAEMAIGNVTGSNIFNALGVMGIPALFGTLTIPASMIEFTIPAMILITILYVFVAMDKQVSKWEGLTLLLLYAAFLGKTFEII